GDIGKLNFDNISKEDWSHLQHKPTMLITEKKLNLMDPEHRKLLETEMVNFLVEGKDVHIDGYTPPSE
ncbi:Fe(2+)-trafficking protein, partial [Vibrio parahaemolyticus]|nr:Fe(2+)-trafficking protein [Vibrio parahaemolyticus]